MDPLTLLAAANAAVAAVKKGCQLYKDIKSAAGDVKGVLKDLDATFQKNHPNPTPAQVKALNEEKARVKELNKRSEDTTNVYADIGDYLGQYYDNYYKCLAVLEEEEKRSATEVYTGGDWMIANGHADMARIECTFRDFDDFTLYKGFVDLFEYTLANYKDLSYSSLSVGIGDLKNNTIIHNFDQLLIENVSQLNFDNSTEDQIAEFSVTFRGRRAKVTGAEFYGNVGGSTAAEQNLLETFLNKAKK